jgi:hypothetical protein
MFFLTGCVGVYKQAELNGVGYRDTKMTDNTYLVRFLGNQRTTQDQTYQYALRRSAELSKQQGYPYFKILKTSSFMREDSRDVKKDVNPMGQYNTTPANDMNEVLDFQNRAASFDDVISIQRPMTVMWIKFYQQPVKGAIATQDVLNKSVTTH